MPGAAAGEAEPEGDSQVTAPVGHASPLLPPQDLKTVLSLPRYPGEFLHPVVYACTAVMLLCLLASVVTYIVHRSAIRISRKGRHTLLNFCFHAALTFTVFAGGINRTKYPILCQAVGIVLHYSTLSTMLWIGVTARNIYKQVTKKAALCLDADQPPYPRQPLLRFYLVSGGVPFIICGVTAATNIRNYGTEDEDTAGGWVLLEASGRPHWGSPRRSSKAGAWTRGSPRPTPLPARRPGFPSMGGAWGQTAIWQQHGAQLRRETPSGRNGANRPSHRCLEPSWILWFSPRGFAHPPGPCKMTNLQAAQGHASCLSPATPCCAKMHCEPLMADEAHAHLQEEGAFGHDPHLHGCLQGRTKPPYFGRHPAATEPEYAYHIPSSLDGSPRSSRTDSPPSSLEGPAGTHTLSCCAQGDPFPLVGQPEGSEGSPSLYSCPTRPDHLEMLRRTQSLPFGGPSQNGLPKGDLLEGLPFGNIRTGPWRNETTV
uniref:Adhesion G protein-coupled receptor A1 n=1 Tax=Saimiri boliviensis boliviensis TaxID=39432 RepID=A0A2K6S7S7_SAIBB